MSELISDFIPPVLFRIKREVWKRKPIPKPDFLEYSKKNVKFRQRHAGERVFILASGPSIGTQDLSSLKNELCIAVSHFHLHDEIQIIKPQYHILAPQHAPFTSEDIVRLFRDFKASYKAERTQIFLGLNSYKYNYLNVLAQFPEYNDREYQYIDYSRTIHLTEDNVGLDETWDICGHPFSMRTVIYGAIQLAVYMGCREIVLLGCDHDYLYDLKRVTNHHFYAEEKGISDKEHLSQFNSEKWFYEYYMRWMQYRLMRDHLATRGIAIINSTNGGMLDVFERVPFEKMLKGNVE